MAKDTSKQRAVARHLYMRGMTHQQIAEVTGVTRQTVGRWAELDKWKEERAAREMSRESITSKTLGKLGEAIDSAGTDEKSISRLTDSLLKAAKGIREINRNTNLVGQVDTFIEFENWLVAHRDDYPELDDKTVALVNRLHSDFMNIKFKQQV